MSRTTITYSKPPKFSTMWSQYPSEPREDLLRTIGWQGFIENPNYENTCAVRMSICLLRCGIRFHQTSGGECIIAPKHPLKGAKIETRQDKLSILLAALWGPAAQLGASSVATLTTGGVVSFFGIPGYAVGGRLGGHIDLVTRAKVYRGASVVGDITCAHGCYVEAQKYWFWKAD